MYGDWSKLYEPEFLNLNPSGQVPTIVDGEFALYEMPAILVYLCEKHGWQDLLPGDVETRGRIPSVPALATTAWPASPPWR